MSTGYEATKELLQGDPSVESGEGATDDEIRSAAERLSVEFPHQLLEFLRDFGWLRTGPWELFGLGNDIPRHLDLVLQTEWERDSSGNPLPRHLLPLANSGSGDLFSIDTHKETGSAPVVLWAHDLGADQTPAEVSPDLAEWLATLLADGE